MSEKKKRLVPPILIVIVALALVALIVMIIVLVSRPTKAPDSVEASPSPDISSSLVDQTAEPAITSAPTEPAESVSPSTSQSYPEGDFTATFPNYDTSDGADYSYQSENIRIAIKEDRINNATLYVADVYVRKLEYMATVLVNDAVGGDNHDYTHNIADSVDALFAINGDYCGNRHEGVVVRNGREYRNTLNEDTCVLYADGTMKTFFKDQKSAQDHIDEGALQVWSFGPALLDDGQVRDDFTEIIKPRNPRTLLGYIAPGHYIMVVVDGRQDSSAGLTLKDCSSLMASLGCSVAYNLDGGQSSEMVFQGQIVNNPSDGGRHCSDIVYIKKD